MVKYPTDLPIDAIQVVVNTIRSNGYSDKNAFAEAIWNVQGYAMSKAWPLGFGMSMTDLTDEQACQLLEVGDGRAGIPWTIIANWALQLISKLLVPKS